ncbi:unnamed protein product [Rhizophagus irregularis]|nr:unnamed protein product [Rhizophagus irregularis]
MTVQPKIWISLVEVKWEDFMKGFAQVSMQMESSLTGHKHKANQIDNEQECTNQSRKGPRLYCMAIRRGTKTNEDSQRRDRDLKSGLYLYSVHNL